MMDLEKIFEEVITTDELLEVIKKAIADADYDRDRYRVVACVSQDDSCVEIMVTTRFNAFEESLFSGFFCPVTVNSKVPLEDDDLAKYARILVSNAVEKLDWHLKSGEE